MNIMDPIPLKNYLAGTASDEEIQQCEAFLNDSRNHPKEDGSLEQSNHDSLIDTLQNLQERSTVSGIDDLVDKIQSMVPRRPIGQDELERVLGPAESDDEMGRIGGYRVIEFIASGGMGLVFKAEDPQLNRMVCIKVPHPSSANNPDSRARFAREAKAAARLRNDRIITVFEVGEHRELPFIVMQLLDGQSLREKLSCEGHLDPVVVKKIAVQVAEGLRYAHSMGYLHRDIKPENIWITTEGDVKLLDFGLARVVNDTTNLTATGTVIGTPSYMSPEQVQSNDLDARSDLFSLGTVLFEMLTGDSPFQKSNLFSTMMSVANDSLEFPESTASNAVPIQLVPIVESLLKKNPDERIPTADQLIEELGHVDEASPVAKLSNPSKSAAGFNRGLTGILGGLAGAACLAFAFFLYQMNDKGTLVVEVDPSVNVSIVDETVTIHDPQTGKDFSITIGDHPLASGVYQLEMTDPSGEYTLSSEVIVIHRGETQIVRIELKPVAEAQASIASNGSESDPIETQPTITLAEIPTLDTPDFRRKLGIAPDAILSRNAMVSKPTSRDGIRSWTIASTYPAYAVGTDLNSDGTLIANYDSKEGMVHIWNRSGEPVHLIPAQDAIRQIRWSPDPNIIAVVESGDLRKQVTVWKLFDDHVEAIDVIATDARNVAWSWDGLLLALQSENETSFVDVSKGSIFAHPNFGITGTMSEHPWSLGGRFFATTVEGSVKVWDLDAQKLFHIFASSSEARFLPSSNEIAIKKASGEWEVWDLESFERRSRVDPESNWVASWPDHQFERVAAYTDDGKLIVKNVTTGERSEHEFEMGPENLGSNQSFWRFHWSEDGGSFVFSANNHVFMSAPHQAISNRSIVSAEVELLPAMTRGKIPVDKRSLLMDRSKNNRIVYYNMNYSGNQQPGFLSAYDLNSQRQLPSPEFKFFYTDAICRLSPDGTAVAITGSETDYYSYASESDEDKRARSNRYLADMKKIRVCSLETGKIIHTFELNSHVKSFLWSPDSQSLVVSTVVQKTRTPLESFRDSKMGTVDTAMDRYDLDHDGRMNTSEIAAMRRPIDGDADQDQDGFVSKREYIDYLIKDRKNRVPPAENTPYKELEIRVFDLSNGSSLILNPGKPRSDLSSSYCFQRSSSPFQYPNNEFANPVFVENQIVVPLFDVDAYPASGRKKRVRRNVYPRSGGTNSSTWNSRENIDNDHPHDQLGFFNFKTGKLDNVVELGQAFTGNLLAVSDRMIMFRCGSVTSNRLEFRLIIDRNNKDKKYVLTERSNSSVAAFLSPKFSYVAQSYSRPGGVAFRGGGFGGGGSNGGSRDVLHISKLDSNSETLETVKLFNVNFLTGTRGGRKYGNIVWHPTEPVIAWTDPDGRTIHAYHVEEDKQVTSRLMDSVASIIGTPEGWLVAGQTKIVEFDLDLNVRKTNFPSQRMTDTSSPGQIDQGITADGKIRNSAMKSNLRTVQLRGNRIETRPLD